MSARSGKNCGNSILQNVRNGLSSVKPKIVKINDFTDTSCPGLNNYKNPCTENALGEIANGSVYC